MMRKRQINIWSLQTHTSTLMLSNLSPFNVFGLTLPYKLRTPRSWDLLVTWGGKAGKPVCFYCKGIYLILYFTGFQLLHSNKCDRINKIICTSPWNICSQGHRFRTVLFKNKNTALTMSFGDLFITHINSTSILPLSVYLSLILQVPAQFLHFSDNILHMFISTNKPYFLFSSVIGSQKNWVESTENPLCLYTCKSPRYQYPGTTVVQLLQSVSLH